MSSYGSQSYGGTPDYGGQTYVVQPDLYQQQGMSSAGYGTQGFGTQGYGTQGFGTQGYGSQAGYTMNSFPSSYSQYGGQTMQPSNYNFGNMASYGNMASGYGNTNTFGSYPSASYGIPDPITTGGMSNSGGSCPYCFGNKGGFKTKKAKRESEKEAKRESQKETKGKSESKKKELIQ